jgi:hypothetical protein
LYQTWLAGLVIGRVGSMVMASGMSTYGLETFFYSKMVRTSSYEDILSKSFQSRFSLSRFSKTPSKLLQSNETNFHFQRIFIY